MIRIYQDNWDKFNAPEFAQAIHTVFKNYTGNPDPYKKVKKENNKLVIESNNGKYAIYINNQLIQKRICVDANRCENGDMPPTEQSCEMSKELYQNLIENPAEKQNSVLKSIF